MTAPFFSQHPSPIALVGIGPSVGSALQRLHAEHLPNVCIFPSDATLVPELLHKVGLLILVTQLESMEDCDAVQAVVLQMQSSGFCIPTLYVGMQPSAGVGQRQKVLAHYSMQTLQMHADATVVLRGEAGEDLCTLLTERVAGLAHAVANGASVGIDINDLTGLLRNAGPAVWVSTLSEGIDRAGTAAKELCSQPGLHVEPGHAYHHAIVWIQGARQSLQLSETRALLTVLSQKLLTDTARLVVGVSHDDSLGARIRVSALLCRPQMLSN